jgi:Aldo/keto reductase family
MTKCGRYGIDALKDFDYSPSTVRKSVERSLTRLNTSYLDTVYLHDVEFVCAAVAPRKDGNHVMALNEEKEAYGLGEGQEGKIWGEGDQKVLDGFGELRKMKEEGLIKNIGITGNTLGILVEDSRLTSFFPLFFFLKKDTSFQPYSGWRCLSYTPRRTHPQTSCSPTPISRSRMTHSRPSSRTSPSARRCGRSSRRLRSAWACSPRDRPPGILHLRRSKTHA